MAMMVVRKICRRLSKFYESCGPGWSYETLLHFHNKLCEPLRQLQFDVQDANLEKQVTECLAGGDFKTLLARLRLLHREEPADVLSGHYHGNDDD